MRKTQGAALFVAALWAAVVAAGILTRPIMPIDETRYVSVAWEMWNTGDYLVPHLNGEIYSQKPPLMFWLITAAWKVFGVHDWVARLIGPAFALVDIFLVGALAKTLWPGDERAPLRAGAALLALPVFSLYSTLLMFDAMLTAFVLIALLGIARAGRFAEWRSWGLIAAGFGGGILTKGPVVLVYLLPVVAAAPWWSSSVRAAWRPFAGRIALGLLAGAGIALAWALPAALTGGPEYREAILWKQTAGRVTHSFAHQQPFWFYFAVLPAVLFPWAYWAPLRFAFSREAWRDEGLRFCATWAAGGIVVLSLVSGKQTHYLLPLLPAVALVAARASILSGETARRPFIAAAGFALLAVSALAATVAMPATSPMQLHAGFLSISAIAFVVAGALAQLRRPHTAATAIWWAAASCLIFIAALQMMLGPSLQARYDTAPFARQLARVQAAHHPILHHGNYQGQFQFTGRLKEALPVALNDDDLAAWCKAHPDGYFVTYWRGDKNPYPEDTEFASTFRGQVAGLIRAHALAAPSTSAEN